MPVTQTASRSQTNNAGQPDSGQPVKKSFWRSFFGLDPVEDIPKDNSEASVDQ